MDTTHDAIIIGTGQAGPSLAGRLNAAGQRVAVIERDRVGGSCVNAGCIPTKTLVASARAAHMARRAADFGIVVDGARFGPTCPRVKARMAERSRASRTSGVTSWLEGLENVDLIRGHGRLEGPRATVRRRAHDLLRADKIFLNVGTRARRAGDAGPGRRGRRPDQHRPCSESEEPAPST